MRLFPFAAILLVLILVFGCAQKQAPVVEPGSGPATPPAENATNRTVLAPCGTGNIVQKDECFATLAQTKSDPAICMNIYSVDKLDACYAAFADSNLTICKRINSPDLRATCLTLNAASLKSEEACNLIDNAEKRAACLKKVVPPCMLVMDPVKRELCNALEKKDYTLCTLDSCFMQYAQNKSNTDACALISTEAERYTCTATVTGSVSECNAASSAPVRDLCVEKASEALGTVDGCDLATAGGDYRNGCYLYFAVKTGNADICKKASPEFTVMVGTSRNWCYGQFANMTANVTVCPRVTETINRIICYRDAAIGNRMHSLCNMLDTDAMMRDCYSASILSVEGGPVVSDCPLVSSQDWKDKCYYKAAVVSYNSTLCTFITPGPDRTSCDTLFGN